VTISFERIAFRDQGKVRRIWAEILTDGPRFLLLREVDREGGDKSYERPDGVIVDVQRLIEKTAIISRKPARQNLTYGNLEIERGRVSA